MNVIRQRLVSLRHRARHLQVSLRRWSLYDDAVSRELKEDLLARFTPAEETAFESDLELTRTRLRPVSIQLQTLSRWFDHVLAQINEQLDRARTLLDQGRPVEARTILNDVETRMLVPNEESLGFAFRTFRQHTSPELHQRLATIDAIIRDLYLPTIKLAQQRGLLPKETLSRTPLAYVADVSENGSGWRQHAHTAQNFGRRLPISLISVPRRFLAQPWNLVAIAHETALCLYGDLDLGWEMANKLHAESVSCGVNPQTAPIWSRWHAVLFADILGVLKLGPAYVSGMIELLSRDPVAAVMVNPQSPVPPAYVRWHVMLQTLALMKFADPARDLFHQVHLLCGDPQQLAIRFGPTVLQLVNECRAVAGLVALSPCRKLGGARVIDVAQPLSADEFNAAIKAKDLLLAGDETCSSDEQFSWAEPIQECGATTATALAGARMALEKAADDETSRRIWVRFWCLEQFLTGRGDPTREREDREFAPGDAVLKQIALHAMPTMTPNMAGSVAMGPMALGPNGYAQTMCIPAAPAMTA